MVVTHEPVFHASVLKRYHVDPTDPSHNIITRKFKEVTIKPGRQVEEILADRAINQAPGEPPIIEYLVKWKDLPLAESSWEAINSLTNSKKQIAEFEEKVATRTSAN